MSLSIGIVGGGAAGMMAAIAAAEEGCEVTLIERNDVFGKKILITGNGKCNFSNRNMSADMFYAADKELISDIIGRFSVEEVSAFFEAAGMIIYDRDQYLYPFSGQAATVRDILETKCLQLGVSFKKNCWVKKIASNGNKIVLTAGGQEYVFDRVIIACGGQAAPKTGSDGGGYYLAKQIGHSITELVPALVQLKCKEAWLKEVAGVRCQASLELLCDRKIISVEQGELQLTDYGISGIPVFQLSRLANYLLAEGKKPEMKIHFLPDKFIEQDAEAILQDRVEKLGNRKAEEFFAGMLHQKLLSMIFNRLGIQPQSDIKTISTDKLVTVVRYMQTMTVTITGSNSFEQAQVTAGGIPLSEVTPELESKKLQNVYFAGEVLDVDGKCGGYNLQWAWSSGYTAGKAAAK